ncbi:hypothetical protein HGRIS_007677 [Hohenbuehelia grisea]|uniref:DNA mismatch repair proteins mutS family domain-containing protein n=1 Tax=Hohenbuehelia grisea TaxID=104357 RepID=A0ABR3J6Z1_9AGAR
MLFSHTTRPIWRPVASIKAHRRATVATCSVRRDTAIKTSGDQSDLPDNTPKLSREPTANGDSSESKPKSRTVTRKSFATLPTAYVRPDGTLASPLEAWWGSADAPVHPVNKLPPGPSRSQPEEVTGPPPDDPAVDAIKPAQRRRRTKAAALNEVGVEEPNEDAIPAKPKRKRKSAAAVVAEADVSTEGSTMIIDAIITLTTHLTAPTEAKPRRRKRTSSSPTTDQQPEAPRSQLATEILGNLQRFPHCILLTRVGQFYESYFEQAPELAHLLGIKLTSRKWGGSRVHMCGFPLMHLDRHLKTLVQTHRRFVAMCEEFPRRPQGRSGGEFSFNGAKEFDRRVVRVITPGTLIDESFLNPYENNYLLAISPAQVDLPSPNSSTTSLADATENDTRPPEQAPVGLAWIDVSTGEFISKASVLENLRDDLARISPREIVLDSRLQALPEHPLFTTLAEEDYLISYIDSRSETSEGILPTAISSATQKAAPEADGSNATSFAASDDITVSEPISSNSELTFTDHEATAFNLITSYLAANFLERPPTLALPAREGSAGRMQIDAHTITALEIRERMRDGGAHGSLLSAIKRTVTNSGTRLLGRWLCSPSTSLSEIQARQSLVAFFHARPHFRDDLVLLLKDADDTGRIVQKFLVGRGEPSDLKAIRTTISVWTAMRSTVHTEKALEARERTDYCETEWASIDALVGRMADLEPLAARIGIAFEGIEAEAEIGMDDPESEGEEGREPEDVLVRAGSQEKPGWKYATIKWTISPEFSSTLATLHATLTQLLCRRENLELGFQRRYNAPSLTLRTSAGQGMHVHLSRPKRDQSLLNKSDDFITIAESGSTKSYFNQEWSRLGSQIVETGLALEFAEREALEKLRDEVNAHTSKLRRNARITDELDVTLAFANLASEMNLVRPEITEDNTYIVENGRHPTVELGLLTSGRVYTPNSVTMTPSSHLHIITGPNMAGKSTLLRQTALISILAQAGSFVPADSARISIVDRLFSRVGAKDDLFHDRSTFMVEMLETAEILRRATPKSLVIMDEVGRGTTVKDGLAIAFATVHHLAAVNRCRALFATHFHELSDMLGYPGPSNFSGQGRFQNVSFFCTDVDETDDGRFAYSYRLRPGVNRDSHGLKVAQLAGMPPSAIGIAHHALEYLKTRKEEALHEELKTLGQELTTPT